MIYLPNKSSLLFILAALLMVSAMCKRIVPVQSPVNQLLTHFPARPDWPDTLHCFLEEEPTGVTISDTLLKIVLDSAQFERLHFGTGEAQFFAMGQFRFAEGLSAGIVRTEEFWFGKQSLLVMDHRKQKCLAVVELTHFYGGDGGQTASESWLFHNKMPPQLFVRSAEHGFSYSDTTAEEPKEYLHESGELFQWEATQFRSVPNPDSSLFLRQYRMHRTW
jgi:hypothetical protein